MPKKEEKVVLIKKGDAIALSFGIVTWWLNKENTQLIVLLRVDTFKSHKLGEFTDFFFTGFTGIFIDFSPEFVSQAWNVDENVKQ